MTTQSFQSIQEQGALVGLGASFHPQIPPGTS